MTDDLDAVVGHYETIPEHPRITEGFGQLELVRTQEVLHRHLPPPPARVFDIGGGTGAHAEWLAAEGYDVHVVDVTPRHVEDVRTRLAGRGVTAEVGDARSLTADDDAVDVALLLGPLYHLTSRDDRLRALTEAKRVVKRGGVVAVAAVSRFASLLDGLSREFLFEPAFRKIVERDLAEGQHRNPDKRPHWFTTAYFHHPDELRDEIEHCGLAVLDLVGVEGLAGWLPHLAPSWEDEERREAIVFAARAVEAEPTLLGLSAHLLAVASVP